ncbi:MAG: DUF393 domain-containing protein, partial [Planctomycetota bacterium]
MVESASVSNGDLTSIEEQLNEEKFNQAWEVEVFFDGECPLCLREIRMLQWMDRRKRVRCTDIADPAFDPAQYQRTMPDFMQEIHGRLPDGNWIVGVEVFRRLYAAIGFGPIVWLSRIPGISHLLDWG